MTTGREAVEAATARLEDAGVPSPRYDAEALLAHVLGKSQVSMDLTQPLSEPTRDGYQAVLDRRVRREPLQHILGSAAFRHLHLEVGPGVFTPRPETEVMTGVAVDELRRLSGDGVEGLRAVDLCAGSGAIGLSMVHEVPDVSVTAVEISGDALDYARRNAAAVPAACNRYDLRWADIADGLPDLAGSVHVVTANPPYIPLVAYETVAPEARDHDPSVALWSGEDGLEAIRIVARVAAEILVDGGLVVCEHADVQGESAPAVFSGTGDWTQVRDHPDLTGRPRFVTARRVSRGDHAAGTMGL